MQPERLLIATDTPTGSGIMPLGMFYTISHLASLGGVPVTQAIAAATGNNARVYRLNSGLIAPGRDADSSSSTPPLAAPRAMLCPRCTNGDIPAIGAVITDGVPRFVGRSRNTPATIRTIRVVQNRLPREFGEGAH